MSLRQHLSNCVLLMSSSWRSTSAWLVLAAITGTAGGMLARRLTSDRSEVLPRSAPLAAGSATGPQTGGLHGPIRDCGPRLAELPADMEKDPVKPGYDPRVLMRLGASASELFDREPRNGPWASAMETGALADGLADLLVLVPEARDLKVECRTRTCLVTWPTLGGDLDRKVNAALAAIRVASTLKTTSVDGKPSVYLVYPPKEGYAVEERRLADKYDVSDPASFQHQNRAARRSFFAKVRSGQAQLSKTLGKVNLPE